MSRDLNPITMVLHQKLARGWPQGEVRAEPLAPALEQEGGATTHDQAGRKRNEGFVRRSAPFVG